MALSIAQLKKLQAKGKIQGFRMPDKKIDRRIMLRRSGKQKYWISATLDQWATENKTVVILEHRFHPTRKWRFDFALVDHKIAVEYEGIFSGRSRHTTFKGYTGDTDKYNAAAALGWKVIRLTAINYKTLTELLNNHK